MDLWSATYGASWNPFTSLIQCSGAWQTRAFFGIPTVEEPLRVGGRSTISTIHHELAHLASGKNTHLGIALGLEGARLLEAFRQGQRVEVSNSIEALLAGLQAPLEGLALYAELDADEASGDLLLPHPILVHSQSLGVLLGAAESDIYFSARDEQIFEERDVSLTMGRPEGLLRLLFAHTNSPENAYYLVGYLWVKAVAAKFAQYAPRLSRPFAFLPILTSLICNHPIIRLVAEGKASHSDIPAALLKTIDLLDAQTLQRLDHAFTNEATVKEFNHLDFHAFLEDEKLCFPRLFDEEDYLPASPNKTQIMLRACASMHFMSRSEGSIDTVAQKDDGGLQIEIECDSEPISVSLGSLPKVWSASTDGGLLPNEFDLAVNLQTTALEWFMEHRAQTVEIANYIFFSDPPVPGIVFWADDGFLSIPTTRSPFEGDGLLHAWIMIANSFRISERRDFAKSLTVSNNFVSMEREATSTYLGHLVSNSLSRDRLERRKLLGVLSDENARRDLLRWVKYPILRTCAWSLEPSTLTDLDQVFDVPGFPELQGGGVSMRLLPNLKRYS